MVLKHKDQLAAARANAINVLPTIEVPRDLDDQSSSNSIDIIYTPSETTDDSMASTAGKKGLSPSLQAKKVPEASDSSFAINATHAPTLTLQYPSAANISKREYIYFLPYPLPPNTEIPYSIQLPHKNPLNLPSHQFEPTSTLVLTSPNRTFVDIRIYKTFSNTPTPSTTTTKPTNTTETAPTVLPSDQTTNQGSPKPLEWAFAGTSTSTPITLPPPGPHHGKSAKRLEEQTWTNVTHATWTHWLDSRYPVGDPEIPVDEGDMYPIAPGLSLEVGHAFHPALGEVRTHEEMWRDEGVKCTRADGDGEGRGSKVCVVLRCAVESVGVRGVVVRVGQYVQGILMRGVNTTVERWVWEGGKDETGGTDGKGGDEGKDETGGTDGKGGDEGKEEVDMWKRSVRVGDGFLPCAVTFRPEVLGVGAIVQFHDFEWVVEECWEWK